MSRLLARCLSARVLLAAAAPVPVPYPRAGPEERAAATRAACAAVSHVWRRAVHADDRYRPERELLSVPVGAEPEELQSGYMAAVEAAKASTPPALLKVKLAELASALRTLTGAWTSEQLAALTGQPLQDSSPQGAGQPLAGPTLQKDASTEVEASARAHRALAAAKEYAARRGTGSQAAGASASSSSSSDGEPDPPVAVPEWVQLGKAIHATWQQALTGLREAAGTGVGVTPAAEARFRGLVRAVNEDIERYNYLVPMARFQQGKKSDAVVEKELARAREQPAA